MHDFAATFVPAPAVDQADPLASVALLASLSAMERSRLARLCRQQRFAAGRAVIDVDAPGYDVLFVIEGKVRVIDQTATGRTVTFAEIAEGGMVGELAAIDGGPRTAAVQAVTDCLVAKLDAATFNALIERHPPVARVLLQRLARIIRDADRRISELSTLDAMSRLCRELLRRAVPQAAGRDERVVEAVPTQEQLASLTGTTRESIARLLSRLQHAGTIRRVGPRLIINDPARLATIAELSDI